MAIIWIKLSEVKLNSFTFAACIGLEALECFRLRTRDNAVQIRIFPLRNESLPLFLQFFTLLAPLLFFLVALALHPFALSLGLAGRSRSTHGVTSICMKQKRPDFVPKHSIRPLNSDQFRSVATAAAGVSTATIIIAWLHRLCHVHSQSATFELGSVETGDGGLSFSLGGHFHEAETFAATAVAIHDHSRRIHCSTLGKRLLEHFARNRKRQITYK